MNKSNVRIEGTGVTHAGTRQSAITRCGTAYDRIRSSLFDNTELVGVETDDEIDCMTCLVKAEFNELERMLKTT